MGSEAMGSEVQAVRRFTRFYTARLGVLQDGLLGGPLPLAQARVLFELAQAAAETASGLTARLGLDPGHLSRLLKGLEEAGLISRARSSFDGRQSLIALTGAGRALFAELDRRSSAEVATLLAPLAPPARRRLVAAMAGIEDLMGSPPATESLATLRPHRPGDMGWIIQRHGALYAAEYGFDSRFEALVARIAADFIERFDPARERAWIAELDGRPVGSVLLVRGPEPGTAKLRLLLVEPEVRGQGLGRRLTDACVGFAKATGYGRIVLWTNSVLLAARAIYVQAGFRLVATEEHESFGQRLTGETWELFL